MSGVGDYLFGTSPKAVQEPTPAAVSDVSGAQQGVQQTLAGVLQSYLQNPSGFGQYTGTGVQPQYAAPVTAQQSQLINQIVNAASPGSATAQSQGTAIQALSNILNSQPMNYNQAFQAVAQPLQQQFTQSTLPAIEAASGVSAGGKFQGGNTGMPFAINNATQNLFNTEGNAAASLAYQSDQANQQNILSALNLSPTVTGAPVSTMANALTAATLPQQTQQTQLTGQTAQYNQQISDLINLISQGTGFGTAGTMQFPQGNTVALPGSEGLLGEVLSAAASSYAKSDVRSKQKLVPVGKLKDGTTLYQFEYKDKPGTKHVGVVAQEVEKRHPRVVAQDARGVKAVHYGKLIDEVAKSRPKRKAA